MTMDNFEFNLKMLISEIIEDIDPEMFFLLDVIYPRALKTYIYLNSLPFNDFAYQKLNEQIAEMVEQEIVAFNARKKFGCPYSIHCPFN